MIRKILSKKNKWFELAGITILFSILISIFLLPSLRAGNFLLPLDVLNEYDSVFEIDGQVAYNNMPTDILLQFLPYRVYNQSHGLFTFWNDNSMGGLPFFEDIQARTLEITNLIASIINFNYKFFFVFSAWLLMLMAAAGMYYFGRELRLSVAASLGAALIFTFSSPVLIWINYTLGTTFIWLPILFLAVEKIYNGNKKWLPILALAICFLLFAGHPQAAMIVLLFLGIYVMCKFFRFNKKAISQTALIGVFILLGIGLSAVQTMPAFNFISQSEVFKTGRGQSVEGNDFISEVKYQFGNIKANIKLGLERGKNRSWLLLDPDHFGNPIERNYTYPERPLQNNYYELSLYVGTLSLILGIIALLSLKKKKSLWFWLISAFLSFVWLASIPFVNLFTFLPILSKINFSRLIFVFAFAVAIMAAYGFDWLLIKIKKYKKVTVLVSIAVLIIIFGDLYYNLNFLINRSDTNLDNYKNDPVVEYLQKFDTRFIGLSSPQHGIHTPLIPNQSMIYDLNDLRGYFVMQPERFFELSQNYMARSGNNFMFYHLLSQNFLSLYNVEHIVCQNDDCLTHEETYPVEVEFENVKILKNEQVLPRAFVSYNYQSYEKMEEVWQVLDNQDYDLSSMVLVETDINQDLNKEILPVEIDQINPDKLVMEFYSDEPGLLVLTDNYYQGWKAFVNGTEKEIIPVFGSVRGVVIEKGENSVEFKYQPVGFGWAVGVSLMSLVSIIVLSYILIRKE